ncbi:hypothetical protein GCM10009765_67030 [Fodinicola feengrottensis]|uniref:Uncharacterized protein n=1 Tax=Fodinicola feengrottensis TaxID=435914 RepID=A0ABP4UM35_9ACTN
MVGENGADHFAAKFFVQYLQDRRGTAGQWRFQIGIANKGRDNPVDVYLAFPGSFPGRENDPPDSGRTLARTGEKAVTSVADFGVLVPAWSDARLSCHESSFEWPYEQE